MQVFYAPDLIDNQYILNETESRHCIKVMRMRKGTPVRLIDGRGNLYKAIIHDPDPVKCSLEITSVIKDFEKRNYRLHIGISPLKNNDRFEWFIEKSVEIGIDEITPVICKRTEKRQIRKERLTGLIVSAMKQSLKSNLTILNDPVTFREFIIYDRKGSRMIAHYAGDKDRQGIQDIYRKGNETTILIGPEGDFTEDEISAAADNGFSPVHLGKSRLRSETAGIAACYSIYFLNQ